MIDRHRSKEALVVFLEYVADRLFSDLSASELVMLDRICRDVLPQLLEDSTLWMVNHPDKLRRMLGLLSGALAVGYHRARTVDHTAWLRCLLAVGEAMSGHPERAHEQLCLVHGEIEVDSVPGPNGIFRNRLQTIKLTERSTTEFLDSFFAAYMEFLKRIGQYDLSNHLQSRIGRLLGYIARDETRPGIAQALFHDRLQAVGYCAFVHATTQRWEGSGADGQQTGPIEYTRAEEAIDAAMSQATIRTHQAVDAWLRRSGYPDGLDERLVRWEIGTVQGDAVRLERRFQGGSIALPLAVAIVSHYLARPVSNDIAFTGAFTAASTDNGQILPIDGVPEKVQQAVTSSCKVIYIPSANLTEVNERPALRNLISEHDGRVVAVETIDQVCTELFPPEGSGMLKDTIKDTCANFLQILNLKSRRGEALVSRSAHGRHQTHIILCSILTAALVFLEGWKLYKAFAADYPAVLAWGRIVAATFIVLFGMCCTFALPAACLRHRKVWSWYAGAVGLAAVFATAALLIGWMLPDFKRISSIYNAPPAAGLVKDVFVMWVFAWAIAANTFNAATALEELVSKRQFVTTRSCLRWDSPLETRMPLRCIHFPWHYGVVCIGAVAGYLLKLELHYYATIDTSTASGYWETFLGLGRDILFIAAIGEVMVFYKAAVAQVRRSLS